MTNAQRKQLDASVAYVIADLGVKDYEKLIQVLKNNPRAREAVLKKVFAFIENEMKLKIVD
jgi:hypothetical protein